VSGANWYRVKPWALVSTVTPLICVLFRAEPEEEGLEDVPVVPPGPGDELPHAAASDAAATNTTAAGNLFRIDVSLHQQRSTRVSGPAARPHHASAGICGRTPSVPPIDKTRVPTPGKPARRLPRYTRYPI
jgi:hypothetical protein